MSNWTNSDVQVLLEDLRYEIWENVKYNQEWLQTTEGDEIKCVSVEELEGIMNTAFANVKERIWED